MLDCVRLSCPGCGGPLEVSSDLERFACGYCGNELLVHRRGGTIALRAIDQAIRRVQVGTDKTAAELAIVRYQGKVDELLAAKAEASRHYTMAGKAPRNLLVFVVLVYLMIVFPVLGANNAGAAAWIMYLLLFTAIVTWVVGKGRKRAKACALELDSYDRRITAVQADIRRKTEIADA